MNTAQKVKGLVWLTSIIKDRGPISLVQINEEWTKRDDSCGQALERMTFHNYVKQIEELFSINIEYVNKQGYKITNPSTLHQQSLQNTLLDKLQDVEFLSLFRSLGDLIQTENYPEGTHYLTTIGEALAKRLCVEITYRTYTGDSEFTTIIQPYCLKAFRRRWYLVGCRDNEKEIKRFSLDRILTMKLTTQKYKPLSSFNPQTYFRDYYGIFVKGKAEKVLIRAITEQQAKYLRSLPIHQSQKEVSPLHFSYRVAITDEFINELLRYTDHIEIMQPESLRTTIRQKLLGILRLYQDDKP